MSHRLACALALVLVPSLAAALPPAFGRRVVYAVPESAGHFGDYPTYNYDSLDWTPARGAQQVVPADVDRDGDVDLVSVSTLSDDLLWHENDGAPLPSFTTHVVHRNPNGRWVPVQTVRRPSFHCATAARGSSGTWAM